MTELPFKNMHAITAFNLNPEAVDLLSTYQNNYEEAVKVVKENYIEGTSKLTVSEYGDCFMVWTKKLDALIAKCGGDWKECANYVNVHKDGPHGYAVTPDGFKFSYQSFIKRSVHRPNWNDAPDWANWLAQDAGGYFGWFQNKPEHTEFGGLKIVEGAQCSAGGAMPIWGHWKFSIQERPVSAQKPVEIKPAAPVHEPYQPEGKCPTALLYYINHNQGLGEIPSNVDDKTFVDVNFELKAPLGPTIRHERGRFTGKEVKQWVSQFHARLNDIIFKLDGEWPAPGAENLKFGFAGEILEDESGFGYTRRKFNQQLNTLRGVPSWDDAPDWAKYLVQDSDGTFYFYEVMPEIKGGFLCNPETGLAKRVLNAGLGSVIGDWRKASFVRPEPIWLTFNHDEAETSEDRNHFVEFNEMDNTSWFDYESGNRTGPVPVGARVNIAIDGTHCGVFYVLCVSEGFLFVRDAVFPDNHDVYNCAECMVTPHDFDKVKDRKEFVSGLMAEIGESKLGNAGQHLFESLGKLYDLGKFKQS